MIWPLRGSWPPKVMGTAEPEHVHPVHGLKVDVRFGAVARVAAIPSRRPT